MVNCCKKVTGCGDIDDRIEVFILLNTGYRKLQGYKR